MKFFNFEFKFKFFLMFYNTLLIIYPSDKIIFNLFKFKFPSYIRRIISFKAN